MPSVAEWGTAVAVLLIVLGLYYRQNGELRKENCELQKLVIAAVEKQAAATAAQASSNTEMARAVASLQASLERRDEGDLSYRVGMQAFAKNMTETASEVLNEIRTHRRATEDAAKVILESNNHTNGKKYGTAGR